MKKKGVNSDMRKPSGLSGTKAMEFNATKRGKLAAGGVNAYVAPKKGSMKK